MKFKIGDIIAVIYFAAFVCLVFFFPWDYGAHGKADLSNLEFSGKIGLYWAGFSTDGIKNFGRVVGHFPYISGFLKVGLLATLGEMIKVRGKTGSWKTPDLLLKFLVWGVYLLRRDDDRHRLPREHLRSRGRFCPDHLPVGDRFRLLIALVYF